MMAVILTGPGAKQPSPQPVMRCEIKPSNKEYHPLCSGKKVGVQTVQLSPPVNVAIMKCDDEQRLGTGLDMAVNSLSPCFE